MKQFYALVLLGFMYAGCSSTNELADSEKENGDDINTSVAVSSNELDRLDYAVDLTTHLFKISGLNIRGRGANAIITVRGSEGNTFFGGGSEPMFVINQLQVQSYAEVYNMITPDDIKSIKVLKGPDAAIYGSRGSNGVIIIKTK
ncbi:MAG: TonB-dependent receptor plug domain-containing protein [Bacteroidota bacterium]